MTRLTTPPKRSPFRHLLRLWLAARSFASVNDLLRGGIPAKDRVEVRSEGS